MSTYIYPVADKYNINPKIYYFKRKYKAEFFVKQHQEQRIKDMQEVFNATGKQLLDSDYANFQLQDFIKTED